MSSSDPGAMAQILIEQGPRGKPSPTAAKEPQNKANIMNDMNDTKGKYIDRLGKYSEARERNRKRACKSAGERLREAVAALEPRRKSGSKIPYLQAS